MEAASSPTFPLSYHPFDSLLAMPWDHHGPHRIHAQCCSPAIPAPLPSKKRQLARTAGTPYLAVPHSGPSTPVSASLDQSLAAVACFFPSARVIGKARWVGLGLQAPSPSTCTWPQPATLGGDPVAKKNAVGTWEWSVTHPLRPGPVSCFYVALPVHCTLGCRCGAGSLAPLFPGAFCFPSSTDVLSSLSVSQRPSDPVVSRYLCFCICFGSLGPVSRSLFLPPTLSEFRGTSHPPAYSPNSAYREHHVSCCGPGARSLL